MCNIIDYLTVYGWCDNNTMVAGGSDCSDSCSCAPCSNLNHHHTYALKVSDDIVYDYAADVDEYLGTVV